MKKEFLLTLSLLLIISALNFSCKKDNLESQIDFPHNMYISKITVKSDVRLFSNKSEINDVTTKNRFIGNERYFNLQSQPIDPTEKITFIKQDTAKFSSLTIKYSFERIGSLYLFYSDFPVLLTSGDTFFEDLVKFNYPNSPLSGNVYETKEVRVGHGNYTELQLSVLSYKFKKGNYSQQSGTLFNEFNDGIVAKIGLNDTLAIREFVIHLNAK